MITTLLLLPALVAPAPAAATEPEQERVPMVAYVARVLAVEEVPKDCKGRCWDFHQGFELQLQPVEVLSGQVAPGARLARHYSHAGFPEFAHYEHALVFEFAAADGALLSRTAFPVALSADGRWTYCAEEDLRDELRGRGRSLRYIGPVRRNEATRRSGEDHFAHDVSEVGKRRCRRGIYVDELVTVYAAEVEPQGRLLIQFRDESSK